MVNGKAFRLTCVNHRHSPTKCEGLAAIGEMRRGYLFRLSRDGVAAANGRHTNVNECERRLNFARSRAWAPSNYTFVCIRSSREGTEARRALCAVLRLTTRHRGESPLLSGDSGDFSRGS